MITINALTAADSVIIPVLPHYLPTRGMTQLIQSIHRVKKGLNPNLNIDGILLTMTDKRTVLSRKISKELREIYSDNFKIFETEIPFSIRAAEAASSGRSLFSYDSKCKAALDYTEFAKELQNIGR